MLLFVDQSLEKSTLYDRSTIMLLTVFYDNNLTFPEFNCSLLICCRAPHTIPTCLVPYPFLTCPLPVLYLIFTCLTSLGLIKVQGQTLYWISASHPPPPPPPPVNFLEAFIVPQASLTPPLHVTYLSLTPSPSITPPSPPLLPLLYPPLPIPYPAYPSLTFLLHYGA